MNTKVTKNQQSTYFTSLMSDQMIINELIEEKLLQTTSLVSIMSPLQPLVETYEKNGGKETIVFMSGLPIPFSIFLTFFTAAYITFVNSSDHPLKKEDSDMLFAIWKSVELNNDILDMVNLSQRDKKPEYVISSIIGKMFSAYATSENSNEQFKEMVYRLDQDYNTSIISPITL